MITFQKEPIRSVVYEIFDLLYAHWSEIALYRDKIKLKPDIKKYMALEEAGVLHIWTTRDAGLLIGYYVCIVMPNLHYSEDLYAVNDIVYISPEYRRGTHATRLFKYIEDELKRMGVSVIVQHVKQTHDFGKLLEKRGYDYTEKTYSKCIKEK